MLDSTTRVGVLGAHSNTIRSGVQAIYRLLALGAEDTPQTDEIDQIVQLMYFAHLGLIFLFLQDHRTDPEFMENNIQLAGDLIELGRKLLPRRATWLSSQAFRLMGLPSTDRIRNGVERLMTGFLHPAHDPVHYSTAENILRILFRFRRLQSGSDQCAKTPCDQCLALHLERVHQAVQAGVPITAVLPAFPAKSPNLSKVTGPLPDLGEELALRFLQDRCDEIREVYPPGMRVVICSDGRVFSDVVGVEDCAVTAYRNELTRMIEELQTSSISVFDLDDLHTDFGHQQMRSWLMEQYGEPTEVLERRTATVLQHQQLFNGIHRFMTEDLTVRMPGESRTQLRKIAKDLAFEVIRRSNAWSKLVADVFPEALRFSIHPQSVHSDKIGIMLGDTDDPWLTPWHGVVLLEINRYVLTHRADAEQRGAALILRDGRPSHFQISPHK